MPEKILSDYEDSSISGNVKKQKVDKSASRSNVCSVKNSPNCGDTLPKMKNKKSKNTKNPVIFLQRLDISQFEKEASASRMNPPLKQAVELNKITEVPKVETSNPNTDFEHLDPSVVSTDARSQKGIKGKVYFKCEECSFSSSYRKGLMCHYRLHSKEFSSRSFDCNFCVYAATERSILFEHLSRFHLKENDFECHRCSYSTDKKDSLLKHLLSHKSKKLLECDECTFSTFYKNALSNHKRSHSKINNYLASQAESSVKSCQYTKSPTKSHVFQCISCSFTTESDGMFKQHVNSHTNENRQRDQCSLAIPYQDSSECSSASLPCKLYQCDKCSFCTIRQTQIEEHSRLHEREFKCDYCSFKTSLISALEEHLRSHSDKAVLNCTDCAYSTNSKSLFDQHLLTHSDQYLLECEQCPYATKSRFDFEQHLKVHLEEELYECQKCPFASQKVDEFEQHSCSDYADDTFFLDAKDGTSPVDKGNSKNASLEQEMFQQEDSFNPETKHHLFKMCSSGSGSDVLTSTVSVFYCDKCSFSTKLKPIFELHSLSHVKEEVTQCEACPFSTTTQEKLEEHSHSHPKKDIFQCQQCPFSIMNEKEFRSHLSSHSKKQIYQCGNCSFSTKKKKVFELHSLSHVKEVVHCDVCPFSTTTLEKLEAHLLTHSNKGHLDEYSFPTMDEKEVQSHSRKEILQCKICSFSTSKKPIFRLHSLSHVKGQNLQCKKCFYSTKDQKKFQEHILTHSKEEQFHDKHVLPTSSREENLKEHLGSPSVTRFRCENCSFSTKKKSIFQIHTYSHVKRKKLHCENSVSPGKEFSVNSNSHSKELEREFSCVEEEEEEFSHNLSQSVYRNDCDTNPRKRNGVMEESVDVSKMDDQKPKYDFAKVQEGNKLLFRCSTCPYKAEMKRHMINHLGAHAREKKFKCRTCPFRTSSKNYIKRHERLHSGFKPHKCNYCPYASSNVDLLRNHSKIHERLFKSVPHLFSSNAKADCELDKSRLYPTTDKFICEICSYSAVNQSALTSHLSRHLRAKLFKCKFCQYSSFLMSNVINHQRGHTKESNVFRCVFCSFETDSELKLIKHSSRHAHKKTFRCDQCDYTSQTMQHLKRHIALHTGEKPLQCGICTYATHRRDYFKNHMVIHSNRKKFKCSMCPKETLTVKGFFLHLKEHSFKGSFKCHICSFSSSSKRKLSTHLTLHVHSKEN